MHVLWSCEGPVTVAQILRVWGKDAPARQPLRVLLSRCEEKGYLKSELVEVRNGGPGRPEARYYEPTVARDKVLKEDAEDYIETRLGSDNVDILLDVAQNAQRPRRLRAARVRKRRGKAKRK